MTIGARSVGPLQYTGVRAPKPPNVNVSDRSPTTNDQFSHIPGDWWIVRDPYQLWYLQTFVGTGPNTVDAIWIMIYPSGAGGASQIDCDVGSANEIAGVFEVLGDGTGLVFTTGNADAVQNRVRIAVTDAFAAQYTTNAGVAVPTGNNLNIVGGNIITTTGVGDTVTVQGTTDTQGKVAMQGAAGPVWGDLTSSDNSITIDVSTPGTIDFVVNDTSDSRIKITVFDTSGNWTREQSARWCQIYAWHGGNGGASGGKCTLWMVNTITSDGAQGGGGGGCGGAYYIEMNPRVLPNIVPITIGSGGPGALGTTTDNSPGNFPASYGTSTFVGNLGNQSFGDANPTLQLSAPGNSTNLLNMAPATFTSRIQYVTVGGSSAKGMGTVGWSQGTNAARAPASINPIGYVTATASVSAAFQLNSTGHNTPDVPGAGGPPMVNTAPVAGTPGDIDFRSAPTIGGKADRTAPTTQQDFFTSFTAGGGGAGSFATGAGGVYGTAQEGGKGSAIVDHTGAVIFGNAQGAIVGTQAAANGADTVTTGVGGNFVANIGYIAGGMGGGGGGGEDTAAGDPTAGGMGGFAGGGGGGGGAALNDGNITSSGAGGAGAGGGVIIFEFL